MSRILAAAALALALLPARGEDVVRPGTERFTFVLGVFLPAFDTDVKVDHPTLGSGSQVDLGEDFGVGRDSSALWTGVEWRFAQRHRIGFTYARFALDGEKTAARDIQIGDEVFPAGATVSAQLKLEIIPITYSYSFLKRERHELAATAGLHWSRMKLSAEGSVSLGSFDASNEFTAKAGLPLPVFGLRYDYHFSPRWSTGAQGALFALKYDNDPVNAEGSLFTGRLYLEYRFARNFALAAALEGFAIETQVSQSEWRGGLDYRYIGPQIYATARF